MVDRATQLITNIAFDGQDELCIEYSIDNEINGVVDLELPFRIPMSFRQLSLIGLMGSFIIAKLCLAESIIIKFPCSEDIIDAGLPILQLLYDVRCYRDSRPLLPLPIIKLVNPSEMKRIYYNFPSNNKAALLWSGGKDSTLSIILLRSNKYQVEAYHTTSNVDAIQSERTAVELLSPILDTPVKIITTDFSNLVDIGKRYSRTFGIFPEYNSIPHGRDFLLLTLISAHAVTENCRFLCTGSEYELFSKTIPYDGSLIHRHDAQSEKGYRLLSNFLSRGYSTKLMAFSPVSQLSEFFSFKLLAEQYPQILCKISACFWGNWCGVCFKCFRYFLLQQFLGKNILSFQSNPLEVSSHLSKYLDWNDKSQPYWEEIHYCLSKIGKNKLSSSNNTMLTDYVNDIKPHIIPFIPEIESYLLKVHEISFLPPNFSAKKIIL